MQVIIMRGIPGSGKSTWVKTYYPIARVVSADKFFTTTDGCYRFDPSMIGEAHNWCLRQFIQSLMDMNDRKAMNMDHDDVLIVDNTNLKVWEIAPYYRLAEAAGCPVSICWCLCDPIIADRRGIHNLPPGKVDKMWRGIEPLPDWWNLSVVYTG